MSTAYDDWVLEHAPPLQTDRVADCLAHLRELATGSDVSREPPFRSAAALSCLVAAAQLASDELSDRSVRMTLRCVAAQGCALWALYLDRPSAPIDALREVLAWRPDLAADRTELVVLVGLLARHDGYWPQLGPALVDTLNAVAEAGVAHEGDREAFLTRCRTIRDDLVHRAGDIQDDQ